MSALPKRLARRLPAYLSGLCSDRERARLERTLAARPEWRAETERLREMVDLLRRLDPAAPVDPRAVDRMLPALRAALAEQRRPRPVWRPIQATALATMLFAGGILCGAQAFPRTIRQTVEVPVERRVEVPVERIVEKVVEVPVEKVVRVPVERTVTRWRTRTVYVGGTRASRPTPRPEASPPAEVVQVKTAPEPAARPAAVDF